MKINFISFFERFIYDNIYIKTLVDCFSRYMYLYPIFKATINNVIILFDYYL